MFQAIGWEQSPGMYVLQIEQEIDLELIQLIQDPIDPKIDLNLFPCVSLKRG